MRWGYPKGGVIIAVQNQAGYDATDDSVKDLWVQLPDDVAEGASTSTARLAGETLQAWVDRVTAAADWSPPASPEASGLRLIPIAVFVVRIPFAKLAAIKAAEASDAGVAAWLEVVRMLKDIDLDDPHTADGLDYLVSKGFIDAADKAAALA